MSILLTGPSSTSWFQCWQKVLCCLWSAGREAEKRTEQGRSWSTPDPNCVSPAAWPQCWCKVKPTPWGFGFGIASAHAILAWLAFAFFWPFWPMGFAPENSCFQIFISQSFHSTLLSGTTKTTNKKMIKSISFFDCLWPIIIQALGTISQNFTH